MNPKLIPVAHHMIQANEGFRCERYKCTRGFWTVGFGHNLDASGKRIPKITLKDAEALFAEDFNKHLEQAKKLHIFNYLDEVRQLVLIDMVFQMGLRGVRKFQKTMGLILDDNYVKASYELLDSRYAREDSPARAERNSKLLRTGFLFDVPLLDINGLSEKQNQKKKDHINQLLLS